MTSGRLVDKIAIVTGAGSGFGKGIAPTNATVSCSKEGYKQTKAFVKTSAAKKPVTAVEIECTMQPVGAK